ncbi:siderophore-interacting protein [Microbacterium resistens]|uniref:siderophore-interacting protein n=1 Tax=Microbacterium resistens TaxID=156977 RepID=UPI0027E29077|nr:siderophore-interacting protein [Microbacterium resistens]
MFAATVVAVREVTPHMRRITVTAPEVDGYAPLGPDEYLGLLMPRDDEAPLVLPAEGGGDNIRAAVAAIPEEHRPDLRWYTLRAHRPSAVEIDIDMVVHGDEGPGTRFARRAHPGSVLGIREAAALYAPAPDARTRLLVGDESSLPAIARILETTGSVRTAVFIEIADERESQDLPGDVVWVPRGDERPGAPLARALRTAVLPDPVDYAWVCGERGGVQEIRRQLVEHGVPKDRITFSGYWRLGEPRG